MLDERPLLALAAAALTWPAATRSPVHRLRATGSAAPQPESSTAGRPAVGPAGRRWLLSAGCAAAVGVLLGAGPVAWSCAAGVALGVERLLRSRAPAGAGLDRLAVQRDLPVVCDLLAVCLGTGLPLGTALAEAAAAVPGFAGERLREVAMSLALGTDPGQAWAAAPVEFAPVGRVLIRAAESGSSVGSGLRGLSAQSRAAAGARAAL